MGAPTSPTSRKTAPCGLTKSAKEMARQSVVQEETDICLPMEMWYWQNENFVKETMYINPQDDQTYPRLIIPLEQYEAVNDGHAQSTFMLDEKTQMLLETQDQLGRCRVGYYKELCYLRELLELTKAQLNPLTQAEAEKKEEVDRILANTEVYFYDVIESFDEETQNMIREEFKRNNKELIVEKHGLVQRISVYETPDDPEVVGKVCSLLLNQNIKPSAILRKLAELVKGHGEADLMHECWDVCGVPETLQKEVQNLSRGLVEPPSVLNDEIAARETKLEEMEKKCRELEEGQKTNASSNDYLQTQHDQLSEKYTKLETEYDWLEQRLNAGLEESDALLKKKDEEIASLGAELQTAYSEKERLEKEHEENNQHVAASRLDDSAQVQDVQAKLDALQERMQACEAEKADCERRNDKYQEDIAALERELASAKLQVEEHESSTKLKKNETVEVVPVEERDDELDALRREFPDISVAWVRSREEDMEEIRAEAEEKEQQIQSLKKLCDEKDELAASISKQLSSIQQSALETTRRTTLFHPTEPGVGALPDLQELEAVIGGKSQENSAGEENSAEEPQTEERPMSPVSDSGDLENMIAMKAALAKRLLEIEEAHRAIVAKQEILYDEELVSKAKNEAHVFCLFLLRRHGSIRNGFRVADVDCSGDMSFEELENFLHPNTTDFVNFFAKRLMEQLDEDKNGTLTIEEVISGREQWALEENDKSTISMVELEAEKANSADCERRLNMRIKELQDQLSASVATPLSPESQKKEKYNPSSWKDKQQNKLLQRKVDLVTAELKKTKMEFDEMTSKATTAMWRLKMNKVEFDRLLRVNHEKEVDMEKMNSKIERLQRLNASANIFASLGGLPTKTFDDSVDDESPESSPKRSMPMLSVSIPTSPTKLGPLYSPSKSPTRFGGLSLEEQLRHVPMLSPIRVDGLSKEISPRSRSLSPVAGSMNAFNVEEDLNKLDPTSVPYRVRIEAAFTRTKRWQMLYADFLHRSHKRHRDQSPSPRREKEDQSVQSSVERTTIPAAKEAQPKRKSHSPTPKRSHSPARRCNSSDLIRRSLSPQRKFPMVPEELEFLGRPDSKVHRISPSRRTSPSRKPRAGSPMFSVRSPSDGSRSPVLFYLGKKRPDSAEPLTLQDGMGWDGLPEEETKYVKVPPKAKKERKRSREPRESRESREPRREREGRSEERNVFEEFSRDSRVEKLKGQKIKGPAFSRKSAKPATFSLGELAPIKSTVIAPFDDSPQGFGQFPLHRLPTLRDTRLESVRSPAHMHMRSIDSFTSTRASTHQRSIDRSIPSRNFSSTDQSPPRNSQSVDSLRMMRTVHAGMIGEHHHPHHHHPLHPADFRTVRQWVKSSVK